MAESADRSGRLGRKDRGMRNRAGPRRRGRDARKCWYGGWRPCSERFEKDVL